MNIKSNTKEPTSPVSQQLMSREQLAARWACSKATIKRREAEGLLKPIRFNSRLLRYRLTDILAAEAQLFTGAFQN